MREIWNIVQTIFAAVGGWLGYFLGGYDGLLYALIDFVVIDYLLGVMCAILEKHLSSDVGAVDTLDIVRQLTEKGVQVIFEKERLKTKDISSSLLIKILATFAEQESRITSENIEWALRKRFERGEVVDSQLFGYKTKKNKEWEIVEREAAIVREAYAMFLSGYNLTDIAQHSIRRGYKKRSGEIDWTASNISSFLTNERYCGDALSRKTCTLDFRYHKTVVNRGHKLQYYVEDHHEGIVSKEEFQKV